MPEGLDVNLVTVAIPEIDKFVVHHHDGAKAAIDAMSPSRQWSAETNLRSWRRQIHTIDPTRENGWAFSGPELQPGSKASLPTSAVIVACDYSWAKANWYAGQYIRPMEIEAALYEATATGLDQLTRSMRRAWARDLIGWLVKNREEIPTKLRAIASCGAA